MSGSPVLFLVRPRYAERLVHWRQASLSPLLIRCGWIANPAVLATESVAMTFASALVTTPLAALLALLITPWAALVALVPLVFFVLPELRLRDRIAQRREGVERELPFFSVVANVLAEAGVPLYIVLRDMATSDMFSSIRQEAFLVRRDVSIFGMNPNESIERLASSHPSSRFADFLLGYTSKSRSGGDVALYLMGESGTLLRGLEGGWSRYVSQVGVVGSVMITAFGVVPLMLTVVGVFSPSFSFTSLFIYTLVVVPSVAIALLLFAGRAQPVREEPVSGRAGISILVSLPGALAAAFIGGLWASVGAALLVFLVAYGLSVREQIAQTRDIEDGIARFLKDLLDFKRQDYDLTRAVLAIQGSTRYNPRFDRLLSRVASQLKAGVPLDEVRAECRSRLGQLAFLLLGQMSRSGGGTVDTVYQISNFTDRMADMKKSAAAEIRPYQILAYISPLLLSFGIAFVGSVLSRLNRTAGPAIAGLGASMAQGSASQLPLGQISDFLIIVSAAALGLVSAKISDFTAKNTLKASVNVALAIAAIAVTLSGGTHSLLQSL